VIVDELLDRAWRYSSSLLRASGVPSTSSTVRSSISSVIIPILIIIDTVFEHRSEKRRQIALEHLITGLLELVTNEQGSQSTLTTLQKGGKETLDRVVLRICKLAKGYVVLLSFLSFSRLALPWCSSCDDRRSRSRGAS
jgi:hypothetical protein